MSPELYELFWPGAFMAFVYGLLFGSFFNVCIYRVPCHRSIVMPGSHCYSCGTALKLWPDNIPLLSYVMLRGNCRYCGSHFSARYFMVELLSGTLFLLVFLRFGIDWSLPFHWAFVGLLLVGTFTDIDHFILPDGVTVGGLIFALVVACVLGPYSAVTDSYVIARDLYRGMSFLPPDKYAAGWFVGPLWSCAGAFFGWSLLFSVGILGRLMFGKEAMGEGDIKLFAFLGAYLGALNCIWILFLASLIGMNLGLTLLLFHKLMRGDDYDDIGLPAERCTLSAAASDVAQTDGVAQTSGEAVPDVVPEGEAAAAPVLDKPPSIRVARRTSRQLHMVPFGPYIAAGALIVLLCQSEIAALIENSLGITMSSASKRPWAVVVWNGNRAERQRKHEMESRRFVPAGVREDVR